MTIPVGTATITFLAIVLSLGVYLVAARRADSSILSDPDKFFLQSVRLDPDHYGDAQVAYALQMSTIFPFFVLAVTGDWLVSAVNALFWLLGILLVYRWLKYYNPRFLAGSSTIHAFVADLNSAPAARRLASGLTIIGFVGVFVFETVYGARVFRVLFGAERLVYHVVVIFLGGYLITYIWNGGQGATLKTDQLQLVLAYAGLHLAVAHAWRHSESVSSLPEAVALLGLVILALSLIMFILRIQSVGRALAERRWNSLATYLVILGSLSFMIWEIGRIGMTDPGGYLERAGAGLTGLDQLELRSENIAWKLATAACIPVFWQFVDMSTWQRINAIRTSDTEDQKSGALVGLREMLVESPLSWLLPIVLGLLAATNIDGVAQHPEPFVGWISHLLTSSVFTSVVGILICVGLVGIFMSTADAALSAVGYAFVYDIDHVSRSRLKEFAVTEDYEAGATVVRRGRRFMLAIGGLSIALFILYDVAMGSPGNFLGVLFAFYTPIIAFSPAIVVPVRFGVRPASEVAIVAMIVGTASGIGLGVYSTFVNPDLQWYAAPIAFVSSWVIYLGGIAFQRTPVTQEVSNDAA